MKALYHYDKIGLLQPSKCIDNGYRIYTENDLLILQQILALKSFGFDLKQIKNILRQNLNINVQLEAQLAVLYEKRKALNNAIELLQAMYLKVKANKSLDFKQLIHLVEAYQMKNELKDTWAGQVFNEQELKLYAEFEKHLQDQAPASEKAFNKYIKA